MSMLELQRALRSLRLSGMISTLEVRAQQVAQHEMNFLEAFSWLVQDELDRRRSRLLDRRFTLSGLPKERKDLKDFDWSYNPKIPRRQVLDLATLKFVEAREDALFIGSPGVGKSYIAKTLANLAVQRGYKVMYREAHTLIGEINEAREFGELRKYHAQLKAAELLVIDDLFLRKLRWGSPTITGAAPSPGKGPARFMWNSPAFRSNWSHLSATSSLTRTP
jgi:DNA replication protein DnaC